MKEPSSPRSRLSRIWRSLTEPSALIEGAEYRRRATLLTSMLVATLALALIAIALTLVDIGFNPHLADAGVLRVPVAATALIAVAYALSRSRFYVAAASLMVLTFFISTFVAFTHNPSNPFNLSFLILGGLISSLFLSTRATIAAFLATLGLIGLVPLAVPGVDSSTILSARFLTLAVGLLIVIATSIHQSDLAKINQQAGALAEREGRLGQALDHADQANAQLQRSVRALEQRNREAALLADMIGLLNLCADVQETYAVLNNSLPQLFPEKSGALYMFSESRNNLQSVAAWGELTQAGSKSLIAPAECWALRRGRTHHTSPLKANVACQHLPAPAPAHSMCVPMVSQGEALGILHLESYEVQPGGEINESLVSGVAEQIALTLTSIRLRETLRNQSIRDPLTGLFNQRYMRETLERELHRAARSRSPMAVIMLDLDHFKQFNDNFGHEAGDLVLRELGALLQSHIRTSDIACRYGGEEFTLVMMDAPLSIIQHRLEMLRSSLRQLNLRDRGRSLGVVTISAGIAMYPEHGKTPDQILRAADHALYRAKAAGRDRSVTAELPTDILGEDAKAL